MTLYYLYYIALLVIAVEAFLYRIRGGFLPTGSTQTARAIWCLPTAAIMTALIPVADSYLSLDTLYQYLYVAFSLFMALMIPHSFGQAYPEATDKKFLRGLSMALIGSARTAIGYSFIPVFGGFTLVNIATLAVISLFGSLQALAYWVGYQLPVKPHWFNNNKYLIDNYTAWGEFLWGGVQGAIILGVAAHKLGMF